MPTKKEVAAKKDSSIALYDDDGDTGFENTTKDDFAIPFLNLLQKLSPQLDPDNPAYNSEAKQGQFFNTVTEELFEGSGDGVTVIPCHYERTFLEWKPRNEGGGLAGIHTVAEAALIKLGDDFTMENGNILSDTRMHYLLVLTEDGFKPAIVSLKSTQIKKSKKLMAQMSDIKVPAADGKKRTLSMYANVYKLTSVLERKNEDTWYGFNFLRIGQIDKSGLANPEEAFAEAKGFRTVITSGEATVDHAQAENTTPREVKSDF